MSSFSLALGFEAPANDFINQADHFLNISGSPRQMLVADSLLHDAIVKKMTVIASAQHVERKISKHTEDERKKRPQEARTFAHASRP
jgi:hypothetical protein